MATQKDKIRDPRKARRRLEGVLAEAILMKRIGWKLELYLVVMAIHLKK